MYKLCKTEQSANRQRALEQGLLAAMATTHFDEISISDLCDRLQIPRKSFYRYFSGKDGALQALIDHTLMQYEEISSFYPAGDTDRGLESFFFFWKEQKHLLDALQRSGMSNVLIERTMEYAMAENVQQQPHAVVFLVSGLMTLVVRWHRGGYRESVQKMAKIAEQILSRPLIEKV